MRLLPIPKSSAEFYDCDEFEKLVEASSVDHTAYLVMLLGGEAGWRCGEIMALEWKDVDLDKRQLKIERSDWKGHVTSSKGGRSRYVKIVQDHVRRAGRRANVKPGVHRLRHTFCSHQAMHGAPARAIQVLAGHQDLSTTQRYMHLNRDVGRSDSVARQPWIHRLGVATLWQRKLPRERTPLGRTG